MRRTRRLALASAAVLIVACGLPREAVAHGLVGEQDLPIPKWLFAWTASIVLVVSFAALAVLWSQPRLQHVRERLLTRLPGLLDPLCGTVGLSLFDFVVYAGLAGIQSPQANVLPTFVYVLFWVALPLVSPLLGDVLRASNPWRAIGRLVGWTAARVARDPLPEPLAYPRWHGRCPAAAGILAFTWVELAFVGRDDPSTLALPALGYAAASRCARSTGCLPSWSPTPFWRCGCFPAAPEGPG